MLVAEFADDEAELTGNHAVHDCFNHILRAACIAVHMNGEHCIMLRIGSQYRSAAVDDSGSGLSPAAGIAHDAVLETGIADDLHGFSVCSLPCGIVCIALPFICNIDDNGIFMSLECRCNVVCKILCGVQERLRFVFAGCIMHLKDGNQLVFLTELNQICNFACGVFCVLVAVTKNNADGIRTVTGDFFQRSFGFAVPAVPCISVVGAAHDKGVLIRVTQDAAVNVEAVLRFNSGSCASAELQIGKRHGTGDGSSAVNRHNHHIDAVDGIEIRCGGGCFRAVQRPFLGFEIVGQADRFACFDGCICSRLIP